MLRINQVPYVNELTDSSIRIPIAQLELESKRIS